ncbi:MAG TPA: adenylate/guanylate cyclase domain-containing protein [Candidatus Limnocylindrales bacterium]|nr:adenylate/guanylate cyclase domain-containing protein [Candidatus Limnocylindrales bacterium]
MPRWQDRPGRSRGGASGLASRATGSLTDRADARPRDAPLTFLFTDVEGSTRLWEQSPDSMRSALARHEVILRSAIAGSGGDVVKTTGDGLMAVFGAPDGAVAAAVAAQRSLLAEAWPSGCSIHVRVGIHTGEAESRGGDFFGPAVNRTARIMSAGHGGQVLLSDATAAVVRGALTQGAALRDLGEHRLKDLGRPQRLFQVTHPALPAEFAPLQTLDLRPNNLPTETSVFVGREAEIQAIRARLDDKDVRLVTLTGPGGSGKTRLAIRAAADQIDRVTDGVYFVELLTATDSDAVLALVATALGLGDVAERSPLDELRRHLRALEVLIVLDNFEQVTVAAPTLVELLADCPGLKLLVTSRQALRVRGEHVLSVPPMSLPTASGTQKADDLGQFEAIQLFVERARGVRADFRLTDDNAAAVADICRRLDGLPLAIELATARLNLFSPEALRERLAGSLKALGSGARDLPERQQTLRATIEWSYQLLTPAEQRLFELLSVFAGASVEAVEAVAADLDDAAGTELDALDGLGSLLDKSLVRPVEPPDGDATPRVVMLETIKAYATAMLEQQPDFADAVRDAHARYFADHAKRSTEAAAADLDNLRVAWAYSVGRRDLKRLGALRESLWPIYEARGWYHATIQLADDLLAVRASMPDRPDDWQMQVTLLTSRAKAITLLRGYSADAEDGYAEALALVKEHGEVPQVYPVLRNLASFHGYRGEVDKAIEYATEILRLADAQDDVSMRVSGYTFLGANTGFAGDLRAGLGHLDEAVAAFESGGFQPRKLRLGLDPRVSCLTTSGFFLWFLGYPDRAVGRADRAIELATDIDHAFSLAYAYYHSGFLHLWRREPEIVRSRAESALRVAEASDLPIWRALGTILRGAATSALGRPEEGLRQMDDGLDQYQGLRTPPVFWPLIRFMQAQAHAEAGAPEPGFPLIDEALRIGGTDTVVAPLSHVVRGDLSLLGPHADPAAATASYERAYAVSEHLGAASTQLRAAVRLTRTAGAGDRPARLDAVRGIHARFTEGLDTPDLVEAAELLA